MRYALAILLLSVVSASAQVRPPSLGWFEGARQIWDRDGGPAVIGQNKRCPNNDSLTIYGGVPTQPADGTFFSRYSGTVGEYAAYDSLTTLQQTTGWSVSTWFRSSSATYGVLCSDYRYNGVAESGWIVSLNADGTIRFRFSDSSPAANLNSCVTSGTNYRDGNWHHVVAVCESYSSRKIYVDGQLVKTDTTSFTHDFLSGSQWHIGGTEDNGSRAASYNGDMDATRLWFKALTAAEVGYLYQRGRL